MNAGEAAFRPAYSSLSRDQLRARVEQGLESLRECRACPRDCAVDRLEDEIAVCKTGRHAVVSSAFPHFGEEDCLRGWNGSGTIFFGHSTCAAAGRVSAERYPEINRRLEVSELRAATRIARELGLRRLDERRPHPLLALGVRLS